MIGLRQTADDGFKVTNMDFPPTCFKYRTPAAALRCLAEGSLYFAKPSELNDTLEAKYDHASPEDFTRVMAEIYSDISQQHGGPLFEINDDGMTEMQLLRAYYPRKIRPTPPPETR